MVDILLSTYNGEKYLKQFLFSLKNQTCKDFRLLIRDDGSSDSTLQILSEFVAGNNIKTEFCNNTGTHLGVDRSYEALLKMSTAGYVMFADQDDIWHDDKVSKMLQYIQQAEKEHRETALLLFSDLTVCNAQGEKLAASFVKYQRISPFRNKVSHLCVQNNVTGCATIINSALRDKLRYPFSENIVCYDWHLALLAASTGKIIFVPEQHADYRKHTSNVFGPQKYSLKTCLSLLCTGKKALHERLLRSQKQADDFLLQYNDIISDDSRLLLEYWGKIDSKNNIKKIFTCLRYGFNKNTWVRTLGQWWAL